MKSMISITCPCGGEYENTPSRKSRHDQTNRHLGYVADKQKAAKAAAKTTIRKVDLEEGPKAGAKPEPISVKAKKAVAPVDATPAVKKVTKASVVRDLLEANPSKSLGWIADEATKVAGSPVSYEYAWDVRKASLTSKAGA